MFVISDALLKEGSKSLLLPGLVIGVQAAEGEAHMRSGRGCEEALGHMRAAFTSATATLGVLGSSVRHYLGASSKTITYSNFLSLKKCGSYHLETHSSI